MRMKSPTIAFFAASVFVGFISYQNSAMSGPSLSPENQKVVQSLKNIYEEARLAKGNQGSTHVVQEEFIKRLTRKFESNEAFMKKAREAAIYEVMRYRPVQIGDFYFKIVPATLAELQHLSEDQADYVARSIALWIPSPDSRVVALRNEFDRSLRQLSPDDLSEFAKLQRFDWKGQGRCPLAYVAFEPEWALHNARTGSLRAGLDFRYAHFLQDEKSRVEPVILIVTQGFRKSEQRRQLGNYVSTALAANIFYTDDYEREVSFNRTKVRSTASDTSVRKEKKTVQ
jgi:hypothetical protein